MTRRAFVTAGWVVVLLGSIVPGASAQPAPATIQGTVLDESGALLVGVTVTATQLQANVTASAVSDDQGRYALPGLTAGTYRVRAILPGFVSPAVEVALTSGEARTLDLTLEIAPLAETVTVTVTRAEQELAAVPQSVAVVLEKEIQFAQRRVSLAEGLRVVPGVFVQHRGNLSESGGVRLSIRAPVRGIGVGVRGLQIVQDGVPLTMADGITQPTNVDLGSTGRVEIIRGPSSVLYGNSANGVISLQTEFPPDRRLVVEPDIQFGSDGYQRQQVKVSGTLGSTGYLINATRMETDGFRDHSHAEVRQANLVIRTALAPETTLRGVFNVFDMPFGESPSTATREDARHDPTAVRSLALVQGFGESSSQGQGGVTLEHRFAGGQTLRSTGWAMWRDVWNPIPFRIIDLGRVGAGFRSELSGSAELGSLPATWTAGLDVAYQRDDRVERENEGMGDDDRAREGALLVDQRERVATFGPFAQVRVVPRPAWTVTAGLRYDGYDFQASDRRLADGDQSGGRTMRAVSPSVGVTFTARPTLNLYANLATAFETPTTVELSNRPSGEGGFNTDLEPERLRSIEAGVRGLIERWRLRYAVTGYRSTLENALVQFQRADEQEFYRNAGESSRNGVEVLLVWQPAARLDARLAYTYQDFDFVRYVTDTADYSGRREPGAPPHQVVASVSHETAFGLRSMAQVQWVDAYPVNNANTVANWAFTVVDLRFGLDRTWGDLRVRPFVGIDNLFDTRYNASTVPNAFGQRYFEPSPGRQVYVGMTVRIE